MGGVDFVKRAAFIQALRDCADFFEAHPSIRTPEGQTLNVWNCTKSELGSVAAISGWRKTYTDSLFYLTKMFSEDLMLEYNAPRETVCRKVVKGTKMIPAQPEREVEDVEWICDDVSLLAAGGEES